MFSENVNRSSPSLVRIAILICSVATAWVFFEWLFFATKPSFMTLYSPWEKVALLCGTALILSFLLLLASLPLIALGWLTNRFTKFQFTASVLIFLPTIVLLAMAALLLFDNFTLTLFGWGIRNAHEPGAWAYRFLTIVLAFKSAGWLHGMLHQSKIGKDLRIVAGTVLVIIAIGVPVVLVSVLSAPYETDDIVVADKELPNIFILSSDGIWSEHMSVYGYERPTTPFLDSVKDEFLIAENHFSNAQDTGGSVVSLLTGKLPTTTKVIYPPDVLRGRDSYQHLPGILKKLGYYNADISMRHYADPFDLNMRDGFSETNFRSIEETGGDLIVWLRKYPGLNPTALFTNRISERLTERFNLMAKDRPIMDPLAEVNKPDKRYIRDPARMSEIQRFVGESHQPFFLHVHMMGTHGSRFKPRKRIYSSKESYPLDWVDDGYDDAIIDFDLYVQEIYALLEDNGLLDSTIFIISSDHGYKHDPLQRVPMMLRMPGQTHTGWIAGNTQRLDIAPTLLELIGAKPPAWMEGRSMLSTDTDELNARLIFASGASGPKSADGLNLSVINPHAPWYSLGRLYMVKCNQGFGLLTADMKLQRKEIEGSTVSCAGEISSDDARKLMLAHLQERGYISDSFTTTSDIKTQ
jgi:arylsulfatase A-like enzyme